MGTRGRAGRISTCAPASRRRCSLDVGRRGTHAHTREGGACSAGPHAAAHRKNGMDESTATHMTIQPTSDVPSTSSTASAQRPCSALAQQLRGSSARGGQCPRMPRAGVGTRTRTHHELQRVRLGDGRHGHGTAALDQAIAEWLRLGLGEGLVLKSSESGGAAGREKPSPPLISPAGAARSRPAVGSLIDLVMQTDALPLGWLLACFPARQSVAPRRS